MGEKIVLVHWVDHCVDGGRWIHEIEAIKVRIRKCESVGFVIFEDKENLILAQSRSDEGDLNCICIYKGCITYRKNL